MEIVRSMTKTCWVITDEELMRGIDYRVNTGEQELQSENNGIDLLLARSFSN